MSNVFRASWHIKNVNHMEVLPSSFLSVTWAPCDANENMEDIEFNLHKHRCSH